MGQTVKTMTKVGDASAIKVDKNGQKNNNASKDDDVTRLFFVGQNPDISSSGVPLLSDEPSMSSIVDTATNDNSTNNNSNIGRGSVSTRLFPKRPWIGCQPLSLSESRNRFTSITTVTKRGGIEGGGEGSSRGDEEGVGGGGVGGGLIITGGGGASNNRIRNSSKTRIRKWSNSSSSILNDISFGSLLIDNTSSSSFKNIQEQQGIKKFISLVANSGHAKLQSDDNFTGTNLTSSPEMEQLITMMKNHKVSEEDNDTQSNDDKKNKKKKNAATTGTAENDLCKGLQIDQSDPKYAYLKSRKILPLPKSRLNKSLSTSTVQTDPISNKDDMMDQNDRENSKKMRHSIPLPHSPPTSTSNVSFDFSIDALKQLPQHYKSLDPVTIKLELDKSNSVASYTISKRRMEKKDGAVTKKQIKDESSSASASSSSSSSDTKSATTTATNNTTTTTTTTANNTNKQSKRSSNSKKKKKGKVPITTTNETKLDPTLHNQSEQQQQSRNNNSSTTTTTTKKINNKKGATGQKASNNMNNKKRVDDDFNGAPGGFLSSDITLFDNPISDDWICLFCQYDVLCYGLEATKRKNGYYRRKRLQRETSRRLGHHHLQSDSDDELLFKDERHIRTT